MVSSTAPTLLYSVCLSALWVKEVLNVRHATKRTNASLQETEKYSLLIGGEYPGGPLRPGLVCNEDDFPPSALPYTKGFFVLGKGGFGTVYKAKQCGSYKFDLAIKQMLYRKCDVSQIEECNPKTHGFDPVELEPMILNLPFVADLKSVFYSEKSERVSILTRLYEGGNLADYLRRKFAARDKIPRDKIMNWGAQIAYGLWQLHRSRFIHNDLKTENVFILEPSRHNPRTLVLSDFGLSTENCDATACTNRPVGTLPYVAPAKLEGKEYGYEVDWWSFAIVLSELAGANPYLAREERKIANLIRIGKPNLDHVKDRELYHFLLSILTRDRFDASFGNDDARARMVSERPSAHPILSHRFWFGTDDKSAEDIDSFWFDTICKEHSLQTCPGGVVSRELRPLVACSSCEKRDA